jgi:HEAT repeat protein
MKVQTLIANLTADDEAARIDAADDLGHAGASEAIAPLVERLAVETSRKVRETIFLALERIDHPDVPIQVVAMLGGEDPFLRNQTVGLLQRKGASAVPVLVESMRSADPDVRKFALDAAAGISDAAVHPIYESALRDPDINILIAALEYLGEQRLGGFKNAVEEIFLAATQPMLVCAAFSALLQIGDATSWNCIRQRYPSAATVPNWQLGWWLRALGDFGPATDTEVFHEILRNHDGKVARDAVDALARFQARHRRVEISGEFWATLRRMLETEMPPEDRLQLLRVLGGFGAPAEIADYLAARLADGDRWTKLGAIEGLNRLGRPDLTSQWRDRCGKVMDAEVAEALGDS